MSTFSQMEQLKLAQAAKVIKLEQDKKLLVAKNKEAAREHLLRMQCLLTRMSTK